MQNERVKSDKTLTVSLFYENFTLKINREMVFYSLKSATMTCCNVTDIPNLPNYKFLWAQMVLPFTTKSPSSSHLGGKSKTGQFYPKINACHNYF